MVYDRAGAAKRIRQRRKELGMTSAEVAGKIGRAVHYYGDIERGTCGMSIETLLDLSHYLDLSVDYILFGQAGEERIDNQGVGEKIKSYPISNGRELPSPSDFVPGKWSDPGMTQSVHSQNPNIGDGS